MSLSKDTCSKLTSLCKGGQMGCAGWACVAAYAQNDKLMILMLICMVALFFVHLELEEMVE